MRVLADRTRRDFQDCGRFVDRQLEQVAQDERSARLVVAALERLAQEPADLDPSRGVVIELEPAALARQEMACAVERRQERLQRARWLAAVALPLRQCG